MTICRFRLCPFTGSAQLPALQFLVLTSLILSDRAISCCSRLTSSSISEICNYRFLISLFHQSFPIENDFRALCVPLILDHRSLVMMVSLSAGKCSKHLHSFIHGSPLPTILSPPPHTNRPGAGEGETKSMVGLSILHVWKLARNKHYEPSCGANE